MSTNQINQASIEDAKMKELLQVNEAKSDTKSEDDDNKLVTRDDLETCDNPVPSLWTSSDRLAKLRAEMQILAKVRIPIEQLPEEVILKAMAEVLSKLGWSDYASFNRTIRRVLTGPPKVVPFAVKTRNQRTGLMDFWLIRVFVMVGDSNKEYQVNGKHYNKRDVLMSHQFCDYLRDFCRTELHDEAQFWTFTGSYRNKQHLDMDKLSQDDVTALRQMGDPTDFLNSNNLVMFQFKKKVPEVYVGGKKMSDKKAEST